MGFRFLRVVVKNLLGASRGELLTQPAGFLSPDLAVIQAAGLVRPPVTAGDGKGHVVLCEEGGERALACAGRVSQAGGDRVTEALFEPARTERFPPQFPVRFRFGWVRQHAQPEIAHEFVVELTKTMAPRREALQ